MWLPHIIVITTHYSVKSKCVVFIYSLLVQIMYIIVNKATFIIREKPKAYIKNNINPINTTSLSHSKGYVVKWQHTLLVSFLSTTTIHYIDN